AVEAVFGRLHGDRIGHAVAWVGPEVGRHLIAGAEGDVQVLGDALGGGAEFGGAVAVDVDKELRGVDDLMQMHVDGAGNVAQPGADVAGDGQVVGAVASHHLDVDGSRQAEVQDLRHDVGRL